MQHLLAHLPMAPCRIGTKAFGVKAVTRATGKFLPVEEGGLGDNVPLGDAPELMMWISCDVSIFSSLCSVPCNCTET